MIPVRLTTERLVLDQPVAADRELIAEFCRDPLFEKYMTLPWPYELKHADYFIDKVAPGGWDTDSEYTWAIRHDGQFLGAIGYRSTGKDFGYWLGAPHRGKGYMTEAARAMLDWLFERGEQVVLWECVVGNTASAAIAQRLGFAYTGTGPTQLVFRDGSHPMAWHGELRRGVDRTTEWPTA